MLTSTVNVGSATCGTDTPHGYSLASPDIGTLDERSPARNPTYDTREADRQT